MTLQKKINAEKAFSIKKYYLFSMKQNWQIGVLFLILSLFALLLSSYICINNINDWTHRFDLSYRISDVFVQRLNEQVRMRMTEVSVIGVVLSAGLAFIGGMISMSYVNSKKSIGFYHSLPIKRESMFVTETTIPAIYYLLSIISGYALSYVMFIAAFDFASELGPLYFRALITAILVYLFVYTIVLLAGSLTGTHIVKVLMTVFVVIWPIAVYALMVSLLGINADFQSDYYLSDEAFEFVSPPFRLIIGILSMYDSGKLYWVFPLIMSVFMYIGAMLLYRYRKSELSGTTVIWKPLFVFVKYAVIFASSLLGAYLFYYIGGESDVTLFIGVVFGAIIAFMLMNCIMYRSTKTMFRDIKAFVVFLIVTIVFFILVPLNVTGLIGKPYPLWNTNAIELRTNDITLEFKDKNEINTLTKLKSDSLYMMRFPRFIYSEDVDEMEELIQYFADYIYKDDKYGYYDKYGNYNIVSEGDDYDTEAIISATKDIRSSSSYGQNSASQYVTTIQKPYIGIPLAKGDSIDTNSEAWEYITGTEEYLELYDLSKVIGGRPVEYIEFDLLGFGGHFSISEYTDIYSDIISKLINACVLNQETNDDHVYLGSILINYKKSENSVSNLSESATYPVFSSDIEIINLLGELIAISYPAEEDKLADKARSFIEIENSADVVDHITDDINAAALVNVETWEAILIDDREVVADLVSNASSIDYNSWKGRQFIREIDTDYILLINYNENQITVRFRSDSVTDTELEAIFNSLK